MPSQAITPTTDPESLVDQILREGELSLAEAFTAAGLRKMPNLFYAMREARHGRLQAIKVCGTWRTSANRVRAWLLAKNAPKPVTTAPPMVVADPNPVLARYGLARDEK